MYVSSVDLTLTKVAIIQNKAGEIGGGLFSKKETISIRNSISEQKASANGGTIQNFHSRFTLDENTFANNKAKYGGAVSVISGNAKMTSTIFTGNFARKNGGSIVLWDNSILNIKRSTFDNSQAHIYDGGVVVRDSKFIADHVNFTGCKASQRGGGAVYAKGTSVIYVQSSSFERNEAPRGGAFLMRSITRTPRRAAFQFVESNFTGNSASFGGEHRAFCNPYGFC